METVLKRVDLRTSVITLGVGAIAVGVARVLLGREVNFVVGVLPSVRFEDLILDDVPGHLRIVLVPGPPGVGRARVSSRDEMLVHYRQPQPVPHPP